MEPARGIEPRPPPYRGGVLAVVTKQASFRELDSNPHFHCPKQCVLPLNDPGSIEPPPGAEPGTFRLQGGCAAGCAKEAKYARRDSNPQSHAPQACPSASCGTSAGEPPPGVEPGRPPYEGGAASRARRHGYPPWIRTRNLRVQSAALLPVELEGIEYAGRDSNPQTTAFEAVSFAG